MTGSDEIGLVWFRRDLRLKDNPAWAAATSERKYVVPLYILDPRHLESIGPFRRRQLLANLQALDYDLAEEMRGRLLFRIGDPRVLVPEAVKVLQAGTVYFNCGYSPLAVARDNDVVEVLEGHGATIERHHGSVVHAPGTIVTAKGSLARGFKTFFNTWESTTWEPWPDGEAARDGVVVLDDPGQPIPFLDEPAPFPEGESEANRRLNAFLEKVDAYGDSRDRADLNVTSLLSTDLHFGTLSPRSIVEAVGSATPGRKEFVRQIALRDWYVHLIADVPTLVSEPAKDRYRNVAWRDDPGGLAAWKGGFTGFPIVDAGMRQLREEGWMPQRVRTICASFLVKNLLIDWRVGEAHFRHLLADGDLSQSVGNWQAVAGVGFDAPGPNRVLNPVSQGIKCDPDGNYVRHWVPELAELEGDAAHTPWDSADEGLVVDYPDRIVDLDESRNRAIEAYSNPPSGDQPGE